MPIVGLTDVVTPRLPSLGKLHKGGEKPERGPGKDLEWFRFAGVKPELTAAFEALYGATPGLLTVYLPFATADENFATWQEEWAAGGLVHRCDGRTMQLWRTEKGTISREPRPCPYFAGAKQRTKQAPGCDEVGRLQFLLPDMVKAGHVGTVTLETHSKHDMLNILGVLKDAEARGRDLRGIPFTLYRRQEEVSTPGEGGQRVTRKKWLVFIEPAAAWVQVRMAIAHANAMSLPAGDVVDGETGEIIEQAQLPGAAAQIAAPASERIDPGPDFDAPSKPASSTQTAKPAPVRPSQAMWDKFDALVVEAKQLGIKAPDYNVAEISADELAALGRTLRETVRQALEAKAQQAAEDGDPDMAENLSKAADGIAAGVPEPPSAKLRQRFAEVAKVACQMLNLQSIYVPPTITAAQLTEMGTAIKEQTEKVKAAKGADGRLDAIAMATLVITAFEARWRGLVGPGWMPSPQWKRADLNNQNKQLTRAIEEAKAKEAQHAGHPVAA